MIFKTLFWFGNHLQNIVTNHASTLEAVSRSRAAGNMFVPGSRETLRFGLLIVLQKTLFVIVGFPTFKTMVLMVILHR